jgi:hypothetical protein
MWDVVYSNDGVPQSHCMLTYCIIGKRDKQVCVFLPLRESPAFEHVNEFGKNQRWRIPARRPDGFQSLTIFGTTLQGKRFSVLKMNESKRTSRRIGAR